MLRATIARYARLIVDLESRPVEGLTVQTHPRIHLGPLLVSRLLGPTSGSGELLLLWTIVYEYNTASINDNTAIAYNVEQGRPAYIGK